MNTVTARSVRRSLIKAGKNPDFPNGFPGKPRGARRNSRPIVRPVKAVRR